MLHAKVQELISEYSSKVDLDQTDEQQLKAMDKENLERLLYALLPIFKLNEQGMYLIGT